MDVMQELEILDEDYRSGDFSRGQVRLGEIWNRLPEPKTTTLNAYLVIEYGVLFALKMNDLDKAWEWALLAPPFRETRQDQGEVEFLMGKVAFERGDLDVAKQNFQIVRKKSQRRIFQGEDPKYLKLIQ